MQGVSMKLDYRQETAKMLKALRKAGYDNYELRRELTLGYCNDSMGNTLRASEESNPVLSGVISNKLYQYLISKALELGYAQDRLFVQVEEGADEDTGYIYAWVMFQEKVTDEQYYYQVLQLYSESKLQSELEAKKQSVEQILGIKITPYTVTQLEKLFNAN